MAEERVQRRLAAILAADVVGYSRLMEADEEGTLARLKTVRSDIIDPKIAEYGGRVFKTTGDGHLAEFSSAVDAVKHAVDVQRVMADLSAEAPENQRIVFRIGISLGDVMVDEGDLFGNGVNVAARMEGLAEAGGICVSGNVHEHLGKALDVGFEDLGEQTVKNLDRPVRCYRVHLDPAVVNPVVAQTDTPTAPTDKPSIAVLPFENMSGDPDQEYFADGTAEDIITNLSRFHWFFVIARNSSFSYKGTSPDVRQVARELGVRYVLEGSVRKGGNRVRVTAQLIDATTGRHVWAERYDRELKDIFAVQDEISNAIATNVAPAFVSAETLRVERKAPENFDAWDNVLRGNWCLWRSKDRVAEARKHFEAALALDPKSSMAHSGLAMSLNQMILFGIVDDLEETRSMAYQAARRAVELDDNDAGAHCALGFTNFLRHQLDSAITSGQRALELNPNYALAEAFLAISYSWLGENDEASEHAKAATRLDPRDTDLVGSLSRTCAEFGVGNYHQARDWAKRTTEVTPDFMAGWRYLAASLAYLGKMDEARAAKDQLLRVMPNDSISYLRTSFPSASPERLEQLVEGLRKAGLPE